MSPDIVSDEPSAAPVAEGFTCDICSGAVTTETVLLLLEGGREDTDL